MTDHYQPERQGNGRRAEDCGDGTCGAHSGMTTGIKGLYAMLTVLIGLIGAQMMFQIPTIKIDILTEFKGITAKITELEKTDIQFRSDITEIKNKINTLEERK